jgi:diguanylate cyclase (GGDEF)-like protein
MDHNSITIENPVVLILAETLEKTARWTEMIRPVAKMILTSDDEGAGDLLPELIVTDSALWNGSQCGVIRIGHPGPADVLLPEQPTERELQLTCRLLSQIVRLRRREHRLTELKKHWRSEAYTDPLTGLHNRRAWDEELKERLEALRLVASETNVAIVAAKESGFRGAKGDVPIAESKAFLCLAIFDLDQLKRINDTFGHLQGDEVLKQVGYALRESLRPDDFVARLGGDEFGLLFWLPNAECAPAVIERVRASIPRQLEKAAASSITASAGYRVVGRHDSPEILNSLVALADAALRREKEAGRNCSVQQR